MEGSLQGQVDLCQGHPEHQPPPHSPQVSRSKPNSLFTWSDAFHSSNTQERKPVTNSRDTQELLPEAGQEMLRIFHTHPARTSLLQDFAFYEVRISCPVCAGPHVFPPAPSYAKESGAKCVSTAYRPIKSDAIG